MTSGFFHLGVYALDGGPWEGPVSWRKPVVFSLSFGIAGYVVLIGATTVLTYAGRAPTDLDTSSSPWR